MFLKSQHSSQLTHIWQWSGFVIIASLVFWAYAPSLFHIPRADQLMYLAEVGHKNDFWSLTFGSYDLNRHRQFGPGDEILFRPLLYFILGAEKFFYGHNFMLWQLTGIVAHLGVVWQLLGLLLILGTGSGAVIAAGFFALMVSNMEMVIWSHITSYMIFLICLLRVLRLSLKAGLTRKEWMAVFVCLTVMCFIYELGNVFTVMFFGWFCFQYPRRRWLGILLLPVALYAALSSWNFWFISQGVAPEVPYMTQASLFSTVDNVLTTLLWWVWLGIFPSEITWSFEARNIIGMATPFPYPPVDVRHPMVYVSIVCFVLAGIGSVAGLRKGMSKEKCWWLVMLTLMMFSFLLLLALGRMNPRGAQDMIFRNVYYSYFFWLILTIILFAGTKDFFACRKPLAAVFVSLLGVLICHNAVRLYNDNQHQAKAENSTLILTRTLDLLIVERRHEPDLSFYVVPDYEGNFKYVDVKRFNDPTGRVLSFAEIIFSQYYRENGAKYKFLTRESQETKVE